MNKISQRLFFLFLHFYTIACFIQNNTQKTFHNVLQNEQIRGKEKAFYRKEKRQNIFIGNKMKHVNNMNNTHDNNHYMGREEQDIANINKMKEENKNEDICFIAGIGDTNGYGWGIAKELSKRNVKIIFGIWPPVYNIFMKNYKNGKFDNDMIIDKDKKMNILDMLPFDASFDTANDIDEETKNNKRYNMLQNYTIEDVANLIHQKYGKINMLVHSLANAKEVQKDLLNTSRKGYLDALSKSSYSLISLCKYFVNIMRPQSSIISLTYHASQKVVPGYGGGMSSAKAALESDTRVLAYHLGRNYNIRINTISAGPLKSRAATAINKLNNPYENNTNQNKNISSHDVHNVMNNSGEKEEKKNSTSQNYTFIDYAIEYSEKYAPLRQKLLSTDIGSVASFLLSRESRAITGQTIYVDNGLNIMFLPDDIFRNKNK
ncbi:enoyl-acyl carrier reductase [Plasmodium sp. DRC-Itaito]|nr:enoyl-acyl carrier reductase [Plasmodium sp. DRC-Itaito]